MRNFNCKMLRKDNVFFPTKVIMSVKNKGNPTFIIAFYFSCKLEFLYQMSNLNYGKNSSFIFFIDCLEIREALQRVLLF